MRIAVLGGGTSGCMAAAQITKEFPDAELVHVFDSRIPIIGVGEGTTPNVHGWLHDITGLRRADPSWHLVHIGSARDVLPVRSER